MLSIRYSLVPVVLLTLCSCTSNSGPSSSRVREFLGPQAVAILSNPQKVQSYRVASLHRPTTAPTGKQMDGYPLTGAGKEFDAAFGHRLAAVLFNRKTYGFDYAKACLFDPGVIFRVWKEREYLDLVLCFTCDEFQMKVFDATGKEIHHAGQYFDGSRAELVRLAKDAFPQDQQIQELK